MHYTTKYRNEIAHLRHELALAKMATANLQKAREAVYALAEVLTMHSEKSSAVRLILAELLRIVNMPSKGDEIGIQVKVDE